MSEADNQAPRVIDPGNEPPPPTRSIVWHDAEGRIWMTNSGPYDDDAVEKIRNGPSPPNTTMMVVDQDELGTNATSLDHYVKNGKVVPRPDLVPGAGPIVNVASLDDIPDLPKGAKVTVDEIDAQILGARGKPQVPTKGNVSMRIDAFPAKTVTVNIQRNKQPENVVVPRMVHPEPAQRKAPAKRKAK